MEIEWIAYATVLVRTRGKRLTINGEPQPLSNPNFIIYAQGVEAWDDGTPITEDEKPALLDEIVDAAAAKGSKFAISWVTIDVEGFIARYKAEHGEPE